MNRMKPYPIDYQGSATHDTSAAFAARMEQRLRHVKAIGQARVFLVACSCKGAGCPTCSGRGYWIEESSP